ncbi:MAG: hypothetical protein ACXWP5_12700 [Bdellovibrionota bacterium]
MLALVALLFASTNLHAAQLPDLSLREKARHVLQVHCGACHIPYTPTSQKNALRVFDLSAEDWSATMSERQLENALARMKDRERMSKSELAEVVPRSIAPPPNPSAGEVELIRRFVAAEQLTRQIR